MDAAIVSFAYPEDYVVPPQRLRRKLLRLGISGSTDDPRSLWIRHFDICFYLSRVKSAIKFLLK